MKRRLVVSFLGITAVVLLLLAIPTAFLLQSVAADETRSTLSRQADLVLSIAQDLGEDDPGLLEALSGAVSTDTSIVVSFESGRTVVIRPSAAEPSISVTNSVDGITAELATSEADLRERVRRAMVVLLGLGVAGLLATWLLAQAEARRLGQPLEELASTAARLGSGDFSVVAQRSGIPEYDTLAATLDTSAARIGALVQAERQFNSDASHQLRSALTGLRLRLEEMSLAPDPEFAADAIAALEQADRLSATVDDLLRLSRTGRAGISNTYDLQALVNDHIRDVEIVLRRARRRLKTPVGAPVLVDGAPGAIGQALDVLLSNAARHGRGTVTVSVEPTDVWVELRVSDEGSMDLDEPDALFIQRDQGGTHGIGLRLARRLVESEGGTIDVVSAAPTTFRIRLPLTAHDDGNDHNDPTDAPATASAHTSTTPASA